MFLKEALDIGVSPEDAERLFDQAEFIMAAQYGFHRINSKSKLPGWPFWTEPGSYLFSRRGATLQQRLDRLVAADSSSPLIKAGLFGGSAGAAHEVAAEIAEWAPKVSSSVF